MMNEIFETVTILVKDGPCSLPCLKNPIDSIVISFLYDRANFTLSIYYKSLMKKLSGHSMNNLAKLQCSMMIDKEQHR